MPFIANGDTKGATAAGMSRSVPNSPGDRKQGSIPIVGSAETLVGRVSKGVSEKKRWVSKAIFRGQFLKCPDFYF